MSRSPACLSVFGPFFIAGAVGPASLEHFPTTSVVLSFPCVCPDPRACYDRHAIQLFLPPEWCPAVRVACCATGTARRAWDDERKLYCSIVAPLLNVVVMLEGRVLLSLFACLCRFCFTSSLTRYSSRSLAFFVGSGFDIAKPGHACLSSFVPVLLSVWWPGLAQTACDDKCDAMLF